MVERALHVGAVRVESACVPRGRGGGGWKVVCLGRVYVGWVEEFAVGIRAVVGEVV